MKDRKLLFFDIDGTLLSEKTHTVPQSAKEALKKAKIGYYPPSFKKVLREQIISTLRNVIYHSGEKVSSIPYRLI